MNDDDAGILLFPPNCCSNASLKDELVCKREEVLQHLANAADTHLVLLHTVNNFVLSFIYNYSENSSKYEYKYEYKVASTSTSTSTQPSSTSTSTSTWNLYSSCTRVQVQVPSTTSLPVITKFSSSKCKSNLWVISTLCTFKSTVRRAENMWKRTNSALN